MDVSVCIDALVKGLVNVLGLKQRATWDAR